MRLGRTGGATRGLCVSAKRSALRARRVHWHAPPPVSFRFRCGRRDPPPWDERPSLSVPSPLWGQAAGHDPGRCGTARGEGTMHPRSISRSVSPAPGVS